MKSLSIHFTDTCNNSCKFCVVNSHKGKPDGVNRQLIAEFLKNNSGQGYESVNIHGGEATICEDLIPVLDMIINNGYPMVSLQTNARKMKDFDFTKELVKRGVKLFVVSVHGYNAEMHDSLTTISGSFDETVQGIRNIVALGAKVRTNTVVCKKNYSQLLKVMDFILSLDVNHINISNLHPAGRAFENFHDIVPRIMETIPYVVKAIEHVDTANIRCTIEGYPKCVLTNYMSNFLINWKQTHFKMLFHKKLIHDYGQFMESATKKRGEPCKKCNESKECGGIYREYLYYYGWDEFYPIKGAR